MIQVILMGGYLHHETWAISHDKWNAAQGF